MPEEPGEQYRRHVPVVDIHCSQTRPEVARRYASVNAGDHADLTIYQRGRNCVQVVAPNARITVRDD